MSSYNDDYPLLGQNNKEPKVNVLRREEEYPNLSSSELLSNEEHQQLFQLLGMFEDVEPSAIITVIRSTKCNMEEAIDKLLDMTCTSPRSSISNSFENSNSLAHSQIQEDQFDNSTFTNSKIEEIPCESNISESATDLESSKVFALDDYTFVENPAYGIDSSQQTFEMEEDFENISSKSSSETEKTDPEEGWSDRNSWVSFDSTSEYEFDGEVQSETQNETSVFETESWPAPLSLSLPKMEVDSLIDTKSDVQNIQAGDSFLSVENNLFQDALERYQEKKRKKEKKDEIQRRLVRSSSLTLSNEVGIASETIDPLFDSIPKEIHEQKIAQLQKEKEKVVEEKRVAMIWCIQHITNTQKESDEKEKIIQEQRQEIERLQNLLKEREEKQNKLEHLLMSGKGAIIEGAQTLQKNISDGISKMEKELKGQDVLEKMKEFLSELRQEISSAFRSRSNSKAKEEKENEKEEEEEDEDLKLAQQASLISFEEETRWREKEKEEEEMVRRLSLSEGDF